MKKSLYFLHIVLNKGLSLILLSAFILTNLPQLPVQAEPSTAVELMPAPGTMAYLTAKFNPAYMKGMVINPTDPFQLDFIIYRGDEQLNDLEKKAEYTKLVKYFLAAMAIPDTDQWVNLSPYEKDRIIPKDFGLTEMGRDLLAQDYLLKQISSSLTHPDTGLGKKFWDKIYEKTYAQYGLINIPINTFNKVWIVPDKALIYEKNDTVYVLENHLKVMTESDYLSMKKHGIDQNTTDKSKAMNISNQIMREIILPAIEKEVNEGKSFAPLRQVFSAMLLATWYKKALKESILGKLYADSKKVKGVDQDPKNNEKIYKQYLKAFKKGAFNMIREDVNRLTHEIIPRKYFSGGTLNDEAMVMHNTNNFALVGKDLSKYFRSMDRVTVAIHRTWGKVKRILPMAPLALTLLTHAANAQTANTATNAPITLTIQQPANAPPKSVTFAFNPVVGIPPENVKYIATVATLSAVNEFDVGTNTISTTNMSDGTVTKNYIFTTNMFNGPVGTVTTNIVTIQAAVVVNGNTNNISPPSNPPVLVYVVNTPSTNSTTASSNTNSATGLSNTNSLSGPSNNGLTNSISGPSNQNLGLINIENLGQGIVVLYGRFPTTITGISKENPVGIMARDTLTGQETLIQTIKKTDQNGAWSIVIQLDPTKGMQTYRLVYPVSTPGKPTTSVASDHPVGNLAVNDTAENPNFRKGGIDLNPANLDLQIKRDGKGVPLPVSQQDLKNIHFDGLVPVILKIQPASDLPLFNRNDY